MSDLINIVGIAVATIIGITSIIISLKNRSEIKNIKINIKNSANIENNPHIIQSAGFAHCNNVSNSTAKNIGKK